MITTRDIQSLVKAANIAGFNVNANHLQLVTWNAGVATHTPTALPNGFSAVYIFEHNNRCLKVGQAGPKSSARYHSQHYNPNSCNSNLSKSIINDINYAALIGQSNVGAWVKTNTTRYNILIPNNYDSRFVNFTEAFFILKCDPLFER
jgi:hypothetical protein